MLSSQKSTASPQAREATPKDAIALLTADHRETKGLFEQYQKLVDQKAADDQKALIATQICVMLTVHTRIEEELFYPAARAALKADDEDLLNEAEVEHAGAKDLIRQLKVMSPGDEMYDAKVKVLGEQIDHHVGEEEGEMFPKLRRTSLDLAELGAQMDARKKVLMASTDELNPLPNELPH